MSARKLATACLAALVMACDTVPEHRADAVDTASAPGPAIGQWGVDLSVLNPDIAPADDFFEYVNGPWLEQNPIPPDRSSYGVMLVVHERAQERVRGINEEQAARSGTPGTPGDKAVDKGYKAVDKGYKADGGVIF